MSLALLLLSLMLTTSQSPDKKIPVYTPFTLMAPQPDDETSTARPADRNDIVAF